MNRYLLSSFIGMGVGFWLALFSGSMLFGLIGGYFAALVLMKGGERDE